MRLLQLAFAAIFVCSTLGSAQVSSAALIMQLIDSFETPAGGLPFVGPINAPVVTHSGSDVLGTRTFKLSSPLAFGDAASIGGGSLQLFTGASAMKSFLSYTFPQQSFPGLGSLGMNFRSLDSGFAHTTTKVEVTLTTSTGNLIASIAPSDSATPFTASIPFSDFTGPGNLDHVSGVEFEINAGTDPSAGTDFVLTQLSVANAMVNPEPGSIAFWSLAVLGAVLGRARRRFNCGDA